MNSMPRSYALKARYIFPVDAPPVHDGLLVVSDHRVAYVAPATTADSLPSTTSLPSNCPVFDLGNVALLPGLVNAHAHLEFSDLAAPLGQPGMSLPTWIREVMQYRQQSGESHDAAAAIQRGIEESIRHGTTTLGEIATSDWTADSPLASGAKLDLTVFRELIAPTDNAERIRAALTTAEGHIAAAPRDNAWHPGLSPHAPYSVHLQLCERLQAFHDHKGHTHDSPAVPFAMHLAESPEELEWLRDASGPFAELLAGLGIPAIPRGPLRPLDYIESLRHATKALFIHGNYLDDEEIARLAEQASTAAVVYCPRTHSFFQHQPYPLAQMLAAGVTVALGTDGRCSNPDLSLLAEIRHVATRHRNIPLDQVLSLGTLSGARALGRDQAVGSLTAGKEANLAIVALPDAAADTSSNATDSDTTDPHELLLHHDGQVVATVYRGQLVHAADTSLADRWPTS